jgi:DNA integrity scanning protein DisA with diadenylate cyclase activity
MFKLLLKILGLDKYEYPEVELKAIVKKAPVPEQKIANTSVKEEKPEVAVEKKVEQIAKPEVKADPEPVVQVGASSSKEIKINAEQLAEKISGLKVNYAKTLIVAGFASIEKIKSAKDSDLVAIKGIGKATVKLIRKNS